MSQEHKGLGGVATSFGIQAGVLLGFSVYIKLEHAFPQTITLERFFLFLALVFFVSTILILIFADEETVRKNFFEIAQEKFANGVGNRNLNKSSFNFNFLFIEFHTSKFRFHIDLTGT